MPGREKEVTKYALIAACVITVAGVVWVVLSDWPIRPRPVTEPATQPTTTARRTPAPAGRWPIFRGSGALRGLADGQIPDTLERRWRFRTDDAVRSSPVVGGGKVFIGSDDWHIYALHLGTGEKEWSFKTGGAVGAPPTLADGVVYVGSADGFLYALDAGTGAFRWKYRTGGEITGAANFVPGGGTAVAGGKGARILVGSYDAKMYCIDAATHREIWTYQAGDSVNGSPAVLDGRVVFGACGGIVYVLSLENGEELAAIAAGSDIASSPSAAGGEAYVTNFVGELLCVDLAETKVRWRYGGDDDGDDEKYARATLSSPAVGADRVVFGSRDRRVHCVARSDGERIWTFPTRGSVDSSPVICGKKVIVASRDGRLYVLRLSDGKKLWSYEIGEPISSSPAVAGSMIVVGCEDGYVYAFGQKRNSE